MADAWVARLARLRVPFGYALGVVYLVFCQPTFASVAIGCVPAVLGMVIRGWASGHLQKNETVTTSGPYAYTRNPLYLGSLLLVIGFAITGRTLWLALVLLAGFFLFYLPAVKAEAEWLEAKFGVSYREYATRVPLLLPRLTAAKARGSEESFRWARYRCNRADRTLIGFILAILLVLGKAYLRW